MGFYAFKISKLSSRVEPGSIALDCSTDCKVPPIGLFPRLSPSINCTRRRFLSSRKAAISEAKSLHREGNARWFMCLFSQRKHARAGSLLRETETTAGLRQCCLSRQRWAGGGGNLTAPHCCQKGFLLEIHMTNLCRAFPAAETSLFIL